MAQMQILSPKQNEYWREANHRWNIKTGATRAGKTYMDYFLIPKRLMAVKGKRGANVILGNTRATLERNVLQPMREIYGPSRVGKISTDASCKMFGETVYCLGADNIGFSDKIRGMSIKWCYGDEITTWSEAVLDMLKSRLDKPYSLFDGTCNPEGPQHWVKRFLDSKADIYQQAYTIYDNPFLPKSFIRNLEQEYEGSVFFQRYILGLWVAAEGVVYRVFNDNPDRFMLRLHQVQMMSNAGQIVRAVIGVDFGGGTSAHAFCCTGYTADGRVVLLNDYREKRALTPEKLCSDFVDFVQECRSQWFVTDAFCDSAEQTLIAGLRQAVIKERIPINVANAQKSKIINRIRGVSILMGQGRFFVSEKCKETKDALLGALWDSKHQTEDVRLDDGTTNIDNLDAMEYSIERELPHLIDRWTP